MSTRNLVKVIILIGAILLITSAIIFYYYLFKHREIVTLYPDAGPTKIRPNELNKLSPTSKDALYLNNNLYTLTEPEKPLLLNEPNNNDLTYEENIFATISDNAILPSKNDKLSSPNLINNKDDLKITKIDKTLADMSFISLNKTTNFYRLQLASVKDEEAGIKMWDIFKNKYPEILNNTKLILKKIDQGNGKCYFLILAGKYKNFSEAKNICSKLLLYKQPCVIFKDTDFH